jgi:hypothetical protein
VSDVEGARTLLEGADQPTAPGGQQARTQGDVVDAEGVVVENPELLTAEDGAALVNLEEHALSRLASQEAIDQAVENLLHRVDATRRLKAALLSMTNRYDWYAMRAEGEPDGKPYLAETGATKVMHTFGIQICHDGGKQEKQEDGTYEYVYTGRVRALAFSEAWFPVVGSRWSGDGFFSKGGRTRVDPGDVRKAAMTNLYNRAIKLATGIKALTWEELEAVPHLAKLRNQVQKIGFTGGAGGASAPAGTLSAMQKGPHIVVEVPYQNTNARTMVKNMPKDQRYFTGKEGQPKNVWIVKYTKQSANRIADLVAENGDVRFTIKNVEEGELP